MKRRRFRGLLSKTLTISVYVSSGFEAMPCIHCRWHVHRAKTYGAAGKTIGAVTGERPCRHFAQRPRASTSFHRSAPRVRAPLSRGASTISMSNSKRLRRPHGAAPIRCSTTTAGPAPGKRPTRRPPRDAECSTADPGRGRDQARCDVAPALCRPGRLSRTYGIPADRRFRRRRAADMPRCRRRAEKCRT